MDARTSNRTDTALCSTSALRRFSEFVELFNLKKPLKYESHF